MRGIHERIRGTADSMTPAAKRRVRQVVDPLLAPVGSVVGPRTARSPVVGLTFDDGPDPETTPEVLAGLAAAGNHATFFMLADRAARHPDIVREVVRAGHEVALHGLDHQRLTSLSRQETYRRLVVAKDILEDVAGTAVRWYRPPYGAQNVGNYLAIRRAGLQPVVWSGEGHDWVVKDPEEVVSMLLPSMHAGSLLLMHDALACDPREAQVADPLRQVRGEIVAATMDALSDRQLRGTTVSDLVAGGAHRTAWFRP